jgi:hypothetical protein
MHDYPAPPPKHFHFPLSFGSIIKLPLNPGLDVAYKDLVCTQQDQDTIIEIITTIADNNKFSLLFNQNHLRSIGAQVNHVHPFKFLTVGMGTPHLKNCYAVIFEDYFKKNGVMEGLIPSLTREAEKGKLEQYLAPFAEEMGVSPEDLRPFIQARDWEGLVLFLIGS